MQRALELRPYPLARHWPAIALALLLPLWCIGTLDRAAWTPDEPRESDVVWRMLHQSDRSLPELAGTTFLEKPPLSYWIAAASNSVFGESIQASRLPNLLYAAVTTISIGALASAMAGAEAALIACLVAGTTLLVLRVSIWLAPDASLLSACALALLGAYRGYTAAPGRRKLGWYALMHLGAAVAFMAKNLSGWIIAPLALATLVIWERNWRELRRVELYAGLVLQAAIVTPWILAVLERPDGYAALRVILFDNIFGRFTSLGPATAAGYATGHRNWPGRYLVELPFSFLPWTFCLFAGISAAWKRARSGRGLTPSWRFCLAASLPFLTLLSIAATARDIYAAPTMIGLSALVALWATDAVSARTAIDRLALRATGVTVLFMAAALSTAMLLLAISGQGSALLLTALATLIVVTTATAVSFARNLDEQDRHVHALVLLSGVLVLSLSLASLAAFPIMDRWQDLPALSRSIRHDTHGAVLAVLLPDETTIAMLDHGEANPALALDPKPGSEIAAAREWFSACGGDALLVSLPGHADGPLTALFDRWPMHVHRLHDGIADELEHAGVATVIARYELPHGRRYALMKAAGKQKEEGARPR